MEPSKHLRAGQFKSACGLESHTMSLTYDKDAVTCLSCKDHMLDGVVSQNNENETLRNHTRMQYSVIDPRFAVDSLAQVWNDSKEEAIAQSKNLVDALQMNLNIATRTITTHYSYTNTQVLFNHG